jgi:hypothetical protein
VSDLDCFRDFIRPGVNGETFDHTRTDAAVRFAEIMERLVTDSSRRGTMASQAQSDARVYDFPVYAERLLADFQALRSPLDRDRTVS